MSGQARSVSESVGAVDTLDTDAVVILYGPFLSIHTPQMRPSLAASCRCGRWRPFTTPINNYAPIFDLLFARIMYGL